MKYILTFFKAVGNHVWEILFSTALLVLLGFILIPHIAEVSDNGKAEICREQMALISEEINAAFEKDDFDWGGVIDEKRSQKFFEALKEYTKNETLREMDTVTYFFALQEDSMTLKCAAHEDNDPIQISMPKKYYTNPKEEPAKSTPITAITVSGVRTYVKGESLDSKNPDKMVFSSSDDLKSLFPDIKVNAQYLAGESKELSKDEYTLSTGGFDMSKAGEKTISVLYKNSGNINSEIKSYFTFEVMEASEAPEFKLKFGNGKKYILAAWAWSDFVKDVTEDGFGASIVYFDGDYLYYPDGFVIDRKTDSTDPTVSAMDKQRPDKPAYYITLNSSSVAKSKDDAKAKDGMLYMDEKEEIYVWQENASKEANSGWLRVYCEIKEAK